MGLCFSKFQSGAARGSVTSVLDPSPPDSSELAAPSPTEKHAKGKNHVAPHPASLPARHQEDSKADDVRPPALQAAGGSSGGLNNEPLSLGSTTPPVGRMKRSQSLAVRNPSKQLSAGSKTNPFPAAAAAATATGLESNPEVPQPESDTEKAKESSTSPRRPTSLRPGLQHRGSERDPDHSQFGGSKQTHRPKKTVTVGLEVIFRDERARLGFFRYLQATALHEKLREVEESENDNENDEMRMMKRRVSKMTSSRYTSDYREDCVLFWLEMSDLLKIPSGGSFQLGLMQDFFDVYIAKGALRQLPMVSAAEREPLHQFLQDKNVERALLAYKMMLLDVLEVVTTHFDEFVRFEGKLGYSQATKSVSMRNVLARLAKLNIGNTGDRRTHLNEIVNTPALCRIFREFLQDRNSVETLLFIIDALAFEDLVNTFDQEPELRAATDGSHHEYCLRQAQKIFNKYIRYGSKAEICLGGAVKEKLLQEIVEYPLGAELFNDAVLVCSAELVHSHLDQFYGTPAYLAYKAARSQARSMKSNRKTSGTILKRHISDEAGGNTKGNAVSSDKAIKIVELGDDNEAHMTDSSQQGYTGSGPLLSLTDILNGSGSSYLRDFLKEEGMENMLFFYKEVAEFQLLPHGQKHYIQSKARKIFDKFVRRGGKLEIELPVDVRRDILWKLSAPTEHTFADAQKYVFNYWEHNYLNKFRHHKLYGDMMNALQKLPKYGLSASGTESKTNGTHVGSNGSGGDWVDVTKITLREFLDLEFLRRFFRLFLEKEQCANELYFYFEILNFQQFPTSDYLSRQAKKLFNRFCDPVSREFVSLKADNRAEIQSNLNNPSPAMFNKAQEEIVSFFTTTLFPKFQQSEIYRTIRITNIELRLGKLAASGNSATAEVSQVRGRNGTMGDVSYAHRPSTSPSRVRNSVTPGAFGGADMSEDQVTVALILEHPETRALFLFFSEEIFCTESIYFWLDCNEFKDIPHKSYLKLRAQKIYRKYISGNAKLQVNLESTVIKEIVAHIDEPSRTLFIPAQKSITKMLERDTLPKFRRSKHQVIQKLRAWAFRSDELTFEKQQQRASTATMVSTAAATRTPGAADGSATPAPVYAQENRAPVHATRVANGPVDALKETSKLDIAQMSPQRLSTPKDKQQQQQITPRRALQVIDGNRMTPVGSRSATASPGSAGLHQQLKHTGTSGAVAGKAPLSGLKRKHRSVEEIRHHHHQRTVKQQQQQQLLSPPLGSAFDHDYESENLAWLDMLVALLERKYGKYSIPVSIKELEDANQFEPLKKKQQLTSSVLSSSGQESIAVETVINSSSSKSSSRRTSGQHVAGKDHSSLTEEPSRGNQERQEKEKEERRQRILLRHAQQIQDTSVSSSTCCGCKTGCLKITRGFCHSSCACEDCKNSRQNKEQRVEAIQNYLANDPRAFSFASHQQNANATGFLHLLPQKSSSVVLRGCRCKKSKCLKKYCECYQNGIACTAHCRCVECSNDPKSAHHLHKEKHAAAAKSARAFHEIQVTVTKKPKRNCVQKSVRLAL